MNTYVKLFSSIIHSTIWRAPDNVRLVWITMLAMSDRYGQVSASLPGLADAARVSISECEKALIELSSADDYSRSADYDGRRIAETPGGWLILNYEKYRDTIDEAVVREQTRLRVRKYRAKKKSRDINCNANCNAETPSNDLKRSVTPSDQIRSDPYKDQNNIDLQSSYYTKAEDSITANSAIASAKEKYSSDELARLISSQWNWSIHGIPPKWQPLASKLEPFTKIEIDYARKEAESQPGKPSAGLLLRVIERLRAEDIESPISKGNKRTDKYRGLTKQEAALARAFEYTEMKNIEYREQDKLERESENNE
jgi:hypothetical protein